MNVAQIGDPEKGSFWPFGRIYFNVCHLTGACRLAATNNLGPSGEHGMFGFEEYLG